METPEIGFAKDTFYLATDGVLNSLNGLSDDLMEDILYSLGALRQNPLRLVCRRWNTIIMSPLLRRQLCITMEDLHQDWDEFYWCHFEERPCDYCESTMANRISSIRALITTATNRVIFRMRPYRHLGNAEILHSAFHNDCSAVSRPSIQKVCAARGAIIENVTFVGFQLRSLESMLELDDEMPCPEYSFLRCSAVAEFRIDFDYCGFPDFIQVRTDKPHDFTVSGVELRNMIIYEAMERIELPLVKHFILRFAKKFTSPPADWDNVMRYAMEREGRTAKMTWSWLTRFIDLSAYWDYSDNEFTREKYQMVLELSAPLAWHNILPFIYTGLRCLPRWHAPVKKSSFREAYYNLDDGILTIVTVCDGETIDEDMCC
ncbi:hypothetical protein BV898_03156 [Hypsibius exemplaris]|uniref:F-box domain-containing protein n=1 Tax=Hypsibius exemplaris TaxID=2072580 RepID=A0A1W0X786_HYPEX|nr:hypothetical protein BV898_03156 [Hypsibius exemplaris]